MNRRSLLALIPSVALALPVLSRVFKTEEPVPVKVDYPQSGYFAGGSLKWPTDLKAFSIHVTRDGVPQNVSYVLDHANGVITFQD